MKHCLMELYWRFFRPPKENPELSEAENLLKEQLNREQKKLLLRMADLYDEKLDRATSSAFESGFKLASTLAFELMQPPYFFHEEAHMAIEGEDENP